MGARVWAAVLAAFCLLSGCAAPETSTALEAPSGWETGTVSPADGNPYAGTGETSTGWLYAVYEAYRGAKTEKYSETRRGTPAGTAIIFIFPSARERTRLPMASAGTTGSGTTRFWRRSRPIWSAAPCLDPVNRVLIFWAGDWSCGTNISGTASTR